MARVFPVELIFKLEEKLGKEEAKEFMSAVEQALEELSILRKLELKDELSKELATKADIKEVRAQIAEVRAEVDRVRAEVAQVKAELSARIDKLEFYIKLMIVLLIIAIALYSPVFADLLKSLLK
ncbi:conserved hypothetical protein [Hydrogenobacter thermophilus TK-6]|uniref:DUF1640 domain-containing protein n=1 Tax=Hydrogenobacter thermophilus (strain DSM 6534 / IAM 12695 / TK-6) TaxID=608538 RepID=D3DJ95_HYDTT|nr:hypothetical protein [Hydrogenobacter thermophilus]ADO45820.1 conserved hypothetical protein [Hydrogenobacter thermophilus TK-6]BAI69897.1 hypothetical protein HTH_1447 [Hydrogenobacter thermophilus TK-6]